MLPRVAAIGGNVVEVHQGGGNAGPLWYRLGSPGDLDSAGQARINWQGSIQYDNGARPSVGGILIQDAGEASLVEVHQAYVDVYAPLWSDGGVSLFPSPIFWWSQGQYDAGYAPAVAMDSGGSRVEVHQGYWVYGPLWYHLYDGNNWGPSVEYDWGHAPSVSVSGNVFVEVHEGNNDGSLWYHVGSRNGSTITWGDSIQYDSGYYPSVSIVGNTVVEVHQGGSACPGPLWYHVGTVQGQQIVWSGSYQYDNGCSPSVATTGSLVFEVHQASLGVGPMWSRLGFLQY
jgi:hypothetical protein